MAHRRWWSMLDEAIGHYGPATDGGALFLPVETLAKGL